MDHCRRFNRYTGRFNIKPEKLFFSHLEQARGESFFTREYYKHPSENEFSGNDIQVQLNLHPEKNGAFSAQIERFGETPNFTGSQSGESVEVHFMSDILDPQSGAFEQISVTAKLDGRELRLHYDRHGNIAAISFVPGGGNGELYASNPPSRSDFKIKGLLETGNAMFRSGRNTYEAKYDDGEEQIVFTRTESGDIKDVIKLPRHVDGKQVFDDLLPKPLLDNVFSADTELDRTWKDFNLETFGVTWDRPTPNPK